MLTNREKVRVRREMHRRIRELVAERRQARAGAATPTDPATGTPSRPQTAETTVEV